MEKFELGLHGKELEEYKHDLKRVDCKWCGYAALDKQPIEHYSHDGGWDVKGYFDKQWLYIICPQCKYEHALWKLGVPR